MGYATPQANDFQDSPSHSKGHRVYDWDTACNDGIIKVGSDDVVHIYGAINADDNNFTTTGTLGAGAITGTSIIKSGGLATEFLKADGSVDSSTYLTFFAETDPIVGAVTGIVTSDGYGNISSITDNSSFWDDAYGWGDHSIAGYLTTLAFAGLSDYPADAAGYLKNNGAGVLSWAAAGAGYTNLTEFVDQTAWRVFYSDGSGDVKELALGSAGKVLTTNGASSAPTWEAAGGATPWDDIADPDADTTIAMAGYETLFTSTLNEAAHTVFTISNTTADLTAAVTLLKLKYTDDGDADGTFAEFLDNSGEDSMFKFGASGLMKLAGGISHDDTSATDWTLANLEEDKDILITINDATTTRTAILVNGDEGSITMARQSYVLAYRSTDLTIADSTLTTIIFQTETTDVLGEYSTSTGVFTAKDAGKYVVMSCVQWEAINNGVNYQLRLYSGTTPVAWDYSTNNIVGAFTQFVGATINLAAGGTISIQCIQYSGGNETIDGSTNYITSLSIQKVA